MKLIPLLVLWLAAMSALGNLVLLAFVVGANEKNVTFCFGKSTSVSNVVMLFAATSNVAVVLLYLIEWNC